MGAGQPPFFKTNEELQQKIDEYFTDGVKIREIIVGKEPNKQAIKIPVPTITGLALFCGFASRQSFYDYEDRPQFSYTIKRARTFIELEYEEQLQVGNTVGAIFALKNMGWTDKIEQNVNVHKEHKIFGPLHPDGKVKEEAISDN